MGLGAMLAGCPSNSGNRGIGVIPNAAAQVAGATLSWTNATENDDGTALTDLAGARFQWGKGPGGPYDTGQVDVPTTAPGASLTVEVALPGPGNWCFVGVHYTKPDAAGAVRTSANSNEVCKVIKPRPKPPRIDKVD
jgi:hypothetical protein